MTDRTDRLPWLTDAVIADALSASDAANLSMRSWLRPGDNTDSFAAFRRVLVAACPEPPTCATCRYKSLSSSCWRGVSRPLEVPFGCNLHEPAPPSAGGEP